MNFLKTSTILSRRISHNCLIYQRNFRLPSEYKPNKNVIIDLPFSKCLAIWINSLKANRLKHLQDELLETMLPSEYKENANIKKEKKHVKIDDSGNYINELSLEIVNGSNRPTKHIVFIHGYGASLGCFARNFQIINKFKGLNYNYKIHFLDNISFGLSSNPKIESKIIDHRVIVKCAPIKLNDSEQPTDTKNLYNKYYKLIDSYEMDIEKFKDYQSKFKPILKEIESYYLSAIDNWRTASGIDKIDYLVGHSYGGYWSGSYSLKYPHALKNLILLSPVGVERHVHAITNTTVEIESGIATFKPSLDPTSYKFLSRLPILSKKQTSNWYFLQPYLPRLLRFLGPWGVSRYYKMWYLKLFKINKLINERGGAEKIFTNSNDLIYGTNKECHLIIEYLYNSITNGSNSDIYIKNLLTPSTVSKWPLYDKFNAYLENNNKNLDFKIRFLYGQFDFMNSEAAEKLIESINTKSKDNIAHFYRISEGGHNLYIDNPFETNNLLHRIILEDDKH